MLKESGGDRGHAVQHLAGTGSSLVMRLAAAAPKPAAFEIPVNAKADKISLQSQTARWPRHNVQGEPVNAPAWVRLIGGSLRLNRNAAIEPMLANEAIRVWKKGDGSDHVKPAVKMPLLKARLESGSAWLVIGTNEQTDVERLGATGPKTDGIGINQQKAWSAVVTTNADPDEISFRTPLGKMTLTDPAEAFLNCVRVVDGRLAAFHVKARTLTTNGRMVFNAAKSSRVSMRNVSGELFFTVDGKAVHLDDRWSGRTISLINGRRRDLQNPLHSAWLYVER
jgi:hypothetical protein